MKLLVCTTNRVVLGGAETYLRALLPRLAATGLRMGLVFESEPPGRPRIDAPGVAEHAWAVSEACPGGVRTAIRAWRPDAVFHNGLTDPAFETWLTRYPVVYYLHTFVGTCVGGLKRHARPSPRPCVRTMGLGCLAHYYPHRCGGLNPLVPLWNYHQQHRTLNMLRGCVQLMVASTAMREEYLRHGFAPNRVVLNPYFPSDHQPDPQIPASRHRTGTVLFAGRLTEVKGGEYLVHALHRTRQQQNVGPPLQLVVAGDGPELPRLKALADRLGVPAAFHGWLDAAGVQALMRRADLLAMPSLWPEPFGLLGIEAGCVGLPAVGYAHGGIPDWLVEGVSGALAPSPPTVDGLADAILRALADPGHYQRLRVGAWETARRFTPERHVERLEAAFRAATAA
jgi:glycosyltransferase involved in cell wall biosynthesis